MILVPRFSAYQYSYMYTLERGKQLCQGTKRERTSKCRFFSNLKLLFFSKRIHKLHFATSKRIPDEGIRGVSTAMILLEKKKTTTKKHDTDHMHLKHARSSMHAFSRRPKGDQNNTLPSLPRLPNKGIRGVRLFCLF